MKTVYTISLIFLMLVIYKSANAQFIDNYGVKLGANISNQYWERTGFQDYSGWKKNKRGLSIYLNGEKQLSKFFSFRPEIGYIEKGYIDTLTFPSTGNSEYDVEIINNRIKLHNLSLNLSVKFYPYETKLKPYLIAGFQGNYFFKYRGFEFKSRGVISKLDKPTFDNFNKFSLNGIIGIGLNYNDLFYIDVEYQPSLTKIYTSNYGLRVWERYVGFTLGLNINKLIDRG